MSSFLLIPCMNWTSDLSHCIILFDFGMEWKLGIMFDFFSPIGHLGLDCYGFFFLKYIAFSVLLYLSLRVFTNMANILYPVVEVEECMVTLLPGTWLAQPSNLSSPSLGL